MASPAIIILSDGTGNAAAQPTLAISSSKKYSPININRFTTRDRSTAGRRQREELDLSTTNLHPVKRLGPVDRTIIASTFAVSTEAS